jgi:hypothetical protein
MRLIIKEELPGEAVHYYNSSTKEILSNKGNIFSVELAGFRAVFKISLPWYLRPLALSRMFRRFLRLDMANMILNSARTGVVILYRGRIYFYDLARNELRQTGRLLQCRNVLYGGIGATRAGIYFGEYGANERRKAVPVWASRDDGQTWQIIHYFPAGSIKHIHGVYRDPFSDRLWIPTGDFAGECFLYSADPDFRDVRRHGDGTQPWRSVSLLFSKDHIYWGMDSQLQSSQLCAFDRVTETLTQHQKFPGPVWYSKQLDDGWVVLQTTVESGPGVQDDSAHVFVSRDLLTWRSIGKFRKDPWPKRYFKFGVLAFADGPQTSKEFVLFGAALNDLDGRAVLVGVEDESTNPR